MARFCEYCGAELQDGSMVCPQCGAIPEGDTSVQPEMPQSVQFPENFTDVNENAQQAPEFVQEEPEAKPKKKKAARWLIPVAVLVVVAVAAAFLWQPVLKMVAPRTYLSMMMNNTNSAIEKRMEGTPADVLAGAGDCLEDGSVAVDFRYNHEATGEVKANITLNSNEAAKQWKLDANATALETTADLSVYMDGDVFAIGSSLLGGNYYGLTYSTFAKDLRSSAFGESMDDETIDFLTDVVDAVDKTIDLSADLEKRLEPYNELLQAYIKELEAETGSEELDIGGKQYKCSTVAFTLEEDGLFDLLRDMLKLLEDEDEFDELSEMLKDYIVGDLSEIFEQIGDGLDKVEDGVDLEATVTYYVYGSKVVNIQLAFEMSGDELEGELEGDLSICYGIDPKKDDTVIEGTFRMDGEKATIKITSGNSWDGDVYTGKTTVNVKADGEEIADLTQKTRWNKENGKLDITIDVDDETTTLSMELKETEDGFTIGIDDLYAFVCENAPELVDEETTFEGSFLMTFRKGASIKKPEFTNLDKINEDVLSEIVADVQESLGGLFGGVAGDDDDDFDFDFDYDDDFDYDFDDDFDYDYDDDDFSDIFGNDDGSIPCTGMAMDEIEITLTAQQPVWQLNIELEPLDTTDVLYFDTSDASVATVDSEGLVTAVGSGTATIYIYCGDLWITCDVICETGASAV